MITLDIISIEGFGNLAKPFGFNLDVKGLNILNSRNGRGKTTIFSALCWVLYGKSLKNKSQVETWEDKRPKNWKGTCVALIFNDNGRVYTIYRCIKYTAKLYGAKGANRLIIVEGGKEKSFKDKNKAQQWIVNKMGMSFELFKNTVVFGQKMKRFIEEDGPTKKAIFEEVFDTAYIQTAKKLAEEMRDGYQKDIQAERYNLEKIGLKLEGLYKLKDTLDKQVKDFERVKNRDIRRQRAYRVEIGIDLTKLRANHGPDFERVLGKLRQKLAGAKEAYDKAREIDNKAFKLDLTIQQEEAVYEGSKKEQKRILKELANKQYTCSLCKQKLSPKHQKEHVKQLKEYLKQEEYKQLGILPVLETYRAEHEAMKKQVINLRRVASDIIPYEDAIEEQKEVIKRVQNLEKEKAKALKTIKQLKVEKPNTDELEKVIKDIDNLEKQKAPTEHKISVIARNLEDCQWLIKDPLSNSGIKAFIFSQMIKRVNQKLVSYSHIINGIIEFGVDLSTGNRDFYITINRDNNIRFYPDLSGGEQQLINICIAFGMYDTISESNPFNLLVLDEVFEGLDDENVEIVGDLVKSKSKGKSLFVITHKRTFIPNGSNIINL